MAAAKISKKQLQSDEFLDTVFDLGEWLEQNWRPVAWAAGAVLLAVALGVAWMNWREHQEAAANDLLAQGLAALQPTAGVDGKVPAADPSKALGLFEQAAGKAGSTAVGDVARFYHARALMALGRPADAAPILERETKAANPYLAGQAKASLAEALEAQGKDDRAAAILTELAAASDGAFPPDAALASLVELDVRRGKKAEASKTYDDMLARFPDSPFTESARKTVGAPPRKRR